MYRLLHLHCLLLETRSRSRFPFTNVSSLKEMDSSHTEDPPILYPRSSKDRLQGCAVSLSFRRGEGDLCHLSGHKAAINSGADSRKRESCSGDSWKRRRCT